MNQVSLSAEEAKNTDIKKLLEKLSSSANGLSSSEAKERIQQYGYNEIAEKKKSIILKLFSYFWGS